MEDNQIVVFHFGGEDYLRVEMDLDDAIKFWQKALRKNRLMEIYPLDTKEPMYANPGQIKMLYLVNTPLQKTKPQLQSVS